jgi:hypothetical protein
MYEGWTRLLIVFLTHPGIMLTIPATGFLMQWGRGLWQASWVMVMHSFSEGSKSQLASWTYVGALLAWGYVQIASELPAMDLFRFKQT